MSRCVKLTLIALPLLAGWLGGCTIVYDDHYRHPHYGYFR